MLFYWLWTRSLLIVQWHGATLKWTHFIISQAVTNENTRIFLHELGKQCCFQYRVCSASALSPIENKLKTRRNHEQWKTAITSLTKQHLWNKHFLTVSCWLKWTSARPRCTAGNLEPLSRDLFAIFVRQWQQGHEEVHASGQTAVTDQHLQTSESISASIHHLSCMNLLTWISAAKNKYKQSSYRKT